MAFRQRIFASALSSLLLTVTGVAHAEVVINELYIDPPGANGGKQWIELFNNGPDEVSIGGWQVQSATAPTANPSVRATIPPGTTLAPGGYWVIDGSGTIDAGSSPVNANQTNMTGTFGLAGGATYNKADMIRLVDGSNVIDTVVYGPSNDTNDAGTSAFLDDSGEVATSLAPAPTEGRSIARLPNGVDTDLSGDDFTTITAGRETPGAENLPPPPVPDAGSASSSSGRPSSSSGGEEPSSSSGAGQTSSASGGKPGTDGEDDGDNRHLGGDQGGCSAGPTSPVPLLLALGALFALRRRKS